MTDFLADVMSNLIADTAVTVGEHLWNAMRNSKGPAAVPVDHRLVLAEARARLRANDILAAVLDGESNADERARLADFLVSSEMESLVWDRLAHAWFDAPMPPHFADAYQWQLEFFGIGAERSAALAPRIAAYVEDLLGDDSAIVSRRTISPYNQLPLPHAPSSPSTSYLASRTEQARDLVRLERITIEEVAQSMRAIARSSVAVHGTITPPSVDQIRRVPIERMFVDQRLRRTAGWEHSEAEGPKEYWIPKQIQQFLASEPRFVILGSPGGGKTTLTSYLTWWIANDIRESPRPREVAIPLVLRDSIREVNFQHGIDIIRLIQSTLRARYQVSLSALEIEYMCATARLRVIFDGLDEILDLEDRIKVSQSINAFATRYPRCNLVVTSRLVGYQMSAVDAVQFHELQIVPFDRSQVESYARKWFGSDEHMDLFPRDMLVQGVVEETDNVEDLRENPLILSLMCTLYRRRTSLPRNRPAVYEACAELLFDTWDRHRKLRPQFEFEMHVDGAIQQLAHWVFLSQDRQGGVPEGELIDAATEYFDTRQFRNRDVSRRAAKSFVDFCKGRAWILSDVETSDNAVLFGFTHRTFLEYFVAKHRCRTLSNEDLLKEIVQHCDVPSWQMVSLIATQLAPSKQEGLADLIAMAICDRAQELSGEQKRAAASLGLGLLESVPLAPEAVERLVQLCVARRLEASLEAPAFEAYDPTAAVDEHWIDGERIAVENRRAASECLVRALKQLREVQMLRARRVKPQLYVPFVLDFAITESSRPSDFAELRVQLGDEMLREAGSGPNREAWLDVALELFQVPIGWKAPLSGALMGNARHNRIGPVKALWNLRELPNALEVFLWTVAHGANVPAPWLETVTRTYGVNGLEYLAGSRRDTLYEPHAMWFGLQQVEASLIPPNARDCVKIATLCVMDLIERLLAGISSAEDRDRLVLAMADRPWGMLSFMGSVLRRRYAKAGSVREEDLEVAEALGMGSWFNGSAVSVESLEGYPREGRFWQSFMV